jgi:hypothetical protein
MCCVDFLRAHYFSLKLSLERHYILNWALKSKQMRSEVVICGLHANYVKK